MAKKIEYGRMLHGGDYNPEQWLDRPDILKKDIEYFKKAHINTVSVGIFSWAVLEPEEGKYNLGWLEEIIDNLYKEGISTILATPSGARPKWMADKYPEVLRMDPDRTRRFFGGRHNHCYTSPVYRQKVHDMDKLLSKRLGSHPGVILWHISNEFGGECYCPLCQQKFREWLKEKYGTIEKLNSSWCTTFWSHIYNSFDQIEAPSPKGENELHALKLDWNRFVTDRTIDFIKGEVAAIREGGSELPVTANLMYDYNGLDYKKFRDVLDVVSWDNYPSWHKKEEFFTAIDAGMQHDLMRSIKNQPFLLMESCPSATNWKPINKLKKPGMMLAASLQAVAHGSDSVLYFQLHQSQGASEKFHKSPAAVLYDRENNWAIQDAQGPRNVIFSVIRDCCQTSGCLPETPFSYDKFVSDILEVKKHKSSAIIALSEGIDRKGRGMLFEMDKENGPMMFSALPYTPHEMENAMHPYELPQIHYTVVRVAKGQMGIAGDDSWGARTQEEYLLDTSKPMEFSFVFKGI